MPETTFNELDLFSKASSFAKNLTEEEFDEFLAQVRKVVNKQNGATRTEKLKQIRIEAKENQEDDDKDELEPVISDELEALFEEGTLGCKVLMHYINKYIPLIYKASNLYPEVDRNDFLTPAYFSIKNCLIRYCPEEKKKKSKIDTVIYPTLWHDLVNFASKEKNLIHIPDKVGNKQSKIVSLVYDLTIELERKPYPQEVLDRLESDPETKGKYTLEEVIQLMSLNEQTDLVQIDNEQDADGETVAPVKLTRDEDDEYLTYNDNAKYIFDKVKEKLSDKVSPKNWDIFMKCNVLGYSCTLVGKEYGVSRQAVNRIANDVGRKFQKVAKELYGKN